MQYNEFVSSFKCETSRITHEFYYDRTIINIGVRHGQRVAIKIARDTRLAKEADIHEELGSSSQHITKFISRVIDDDGSICILMEGVGDGTTLYDWRHTSEAISIRKCVNLISQVVCGLQYIHSHGIIHHDLKAQNILVTPNPNGNGHLLKICDFGCSEFVDENGHGSEELRRVGTAANMAPEQEDDKLMPITQKIDIYAIGAIGYTILGIGRRDIVKDSPIMLIDLLRRCQKSNPDDRPTIEEMTNRLINLDYRTHADNIRGISAMRRTLDAAIQLVGVFVPKEILDMNERVRKLEEAYTGL